MLYAVRVRRAVEHGVAEPLDTKAERDTHRDVRESEQGAADERTDKHAPS